MITVIRNPEGFEAAYTAALNRSFGRWGDSELYDWCFRRRVGRHEAEILILKNGDDVIAGSAVTFRTIALPGSPIIDVAFMTGSWTSPEARGKGCFTRIIEESFAIAVEKGTEALLAFVTEQNPSRRRLEAAGAALVPTDYLASGHNPRVPSAPATVESLHDLDSVIDLVHARATVAADRARFSYTRDEFAGQFCQGPRTIHALAVGADALALVERRPQQDRLLHLSLGPSTSFHDAVTALIAKAAAVGRELLAFTADPLWTAEWLDMGCLRSPGFLTVMPCRTDAAPNALTREQWNIQSGDRM